MVLISLRGGKLFGRAFYNGRFRAPALIASGVKRMIDKTEILNTFVVLAEFEDGERIVGGTIQNGEIKVVEQANGYFKKWKQ